MTAPIQKSGSTNTDSSIKTTLEFDDRVTRDVRSRAAAEGRWLTQLIHRARRDCLHRRPPAPPFKLDLLTKKGRVLPGVDPDDRDALHEKTDEQA